MPRRSRVCVTRSVMRVASPCTFTPALAVGARVYLSSQFFSEHKVCQHAMDLFRCRARIAFLNPCERQILNSFVQSIHYAHFPPGWHAPNQFDLHLLNFGMRVRIQSTHEASISALSRPCWRMVSVTLFSRPAVPYGSRRGRRPSPSLRVDDGELLNADGNWIARIGSADSLNPLILYQDVFQKDEPMKEGPCRKALLSLIQLLID